MDGLQKQDGEGATAVVARGFEPVRIERQLLARVFDLVCEIEKRASQSVAGIPERPIAEQQIAVSSARRRRA